MVACPCSACGCSIDDLLSFSSSPCIEKLLASNEPPSDTERVAISDENGQLRSQIAELNTRISRAEASLKQLQTAEAALEAQLAVRVRILNPISTLPTDILCEVFARCAEPDDLPTLRGRFSGLFTSHEKAPWLLAAVSKRWRTAAIAFSQLWSHIAIDLDNLSLDLRLKPHDLYYNRLLLRLQRSQQYPLSLYLMSETASFGEFPDIVHVLSETSHRWKHLLLRGQLPLLQSLFDQELPLLLLQTIHIDVYDAPVNTLRSSLFRNAPSLAHLTVPADVLLHFEWPTSQITVCTIFTAIRAIPDSRVCSVIRQFPRLQALDLTYRWYMSSRDEPHESPIILSSLTKLTLCSFSSGDQMLEALVLPNLTCLCLKGDLSSTTFRWIQTLHARSNFNLSKLTLEYVTDLTLPDIVFHLLEAFPGISELSFRFPYNHIETILTQLAEETTMVPNLKVLSLYKQVEFSENCLIVLANSRPDLYVTYCCCD